MTSVDPRANPSALDVSSVSGGLGSRIVELLGLVNQATGQVGSGTKSVLLEGLEDASILNTYLQNNNGGAEWQDDQSYYFQTATQKLSQIDAIVKKNIEDLEKNLGDNIGQLFGLLNSKGQALDPNQNQIINSLSAEQIQSLGLNLENQLSTNLTSDAALNELMNSFFAQIQLTTEKINQEIFDLLSDFDTNYADGSLDNAKYILFDNSGKAEIINSLDQLFNHTITKAQTAFNTANPGANFSQDNYINNSIQYLYSSGSLKLSPGLAQAIIDTKSYSPEDLSAFHNSSDFLKAISYQELLSIANNHYGTSGSATLEKLFKDNLDIGTPKYFEDDRNLYDLLFGSAQLNDPNGLRTNLGMSVEDILDNVSYSSIELLELGYNKAPSSKLQADIRRNPLAAIKYLETKRNDPATSQEQKDEIANLIPALVERQIRLSAYELKKTRGENELIDSGELNSINNELTSLVSNYDPSKLDGIIDRLNSWMANTYNPNNTNPNYKNQYSVTIDPSLSLDDVLKNIDQGTDLFSSHKLLYVSELQEAGKINSRFFGQKLATPQQDGTIPEDTRPIPPWVSPTIYSGIIAKLGNTLLEKTAALAQSSQDQPFSSQSWVDQNASFVTRLGTQISSGAISSGGQALIDKLKANFKGIIQNFYQEFEPQKQEAANLKTLLDDTLAEKTRLQALIDPQDENPQATLRNGLVSFLAGRGHSVPEGIEPDLYAADLYRDKLIEYSEGVSNFTKDLDNDGKADIEERFASSITDSGLDIDNNGVNDFIDLKGISDNIKIITDQMTNRLGDGSADPSGKVEDQSIRRLILMMFVFNMLESGSWDSATSDADTSRYEVIT